MCVCMCVVLELLIHVCVYVRGVRVAYTCVCMCVVLELLIHVCVCAWC